MEKDILQKIHREFENNRDQFILISGVHKRSLSSCEFILANYNNPEAPIDSLRKHLKYYKYSFTYNPSNSSVEALVNSGHLNILRNKELGDILIEWDEMVKDYEEEERFNRDFQDRFIIPFDLKYFNLYAINEDERYDAFFTFNELELNEFLNIVAVKGRLLGQIVNNPQEESTRLYRALDFIISNSAQSD